MKPFSLDLRQRVLADYQAGLTFAELGRKYTTSAEWVRQFIRRYEATGEVAARPPRIKKLPFHRRYEADLRAAVAAQPDLTLEGLRAKLGLDVSIGTLWNALRALKISFKKTLVAASTRSNPSSGRSSTRCASGSRGPRRRATPSAASASTGSPPPSAATTSATPATTHKTRIENVDGLQKRRRWRPNPSPSCLRPSSRPQPFPGPA